jgi:hypothetical protein
MKVTRSKTELIKDYKITDLSEKYFVANYAANNQYRFQVKPPTLKEIFRAEALRKRTN